MARSVTMTSASRLLTILAKPRMTNVVSLNGTSAYINCGNHASLTGINTGTFTIEFYSKQKVYSDFQHYYGAYIDPESSSTFSMYNGSTVQARCYVGAETTNARTNIVFTVDSIWHHWSICYNNTGDRKIYVYRDGVQVGSVSSIADGDVLDLTGSNLYIGTRGNATGHFFNGNFGWFRISDNIRYSATFTPDSIRKPPAVDANTVRLFKMDEGTGTTITDYSANAQNATLVNGTWAKT